MDFKTAVANEILAALKAAFGDVDIAPEAIAAAILVAVIGKALLSIKNRQ